VRPSLSTLAIVLLCSLASLARAADRPLLSAAFVDCTAADEVLAIVELELDARVVIGDGVLPAHATRVHVRCDASSARLEVSDPLTRKDVSRVVSLEHVHASARTRVIAIAVAELVSASWFELERSPHAPEGALEAAEHSALQSVRRRALLWRVSLGLGPLLRLSAAARAPAPGGSLQLLAQSPWSPLLLFDLSGFYSTYALELGRVDTLAASFGAAGLLHAQRGAWGAHAGTGLRAGVARLRGRTRDAEQARDGDVSGGWLGPMLVAGGSLDADAWGSLHVLGELGYTLFAVRGAVDGRDAVALDGLWLGVALSWHVPL
jgi:hypothetical protein